MLSSTVYWNVRTTYDAAPFNMRYLSEDRDIAGSYIILEGMQS